ncbi:MAG: glycosyltransferase [Anaerolineae bacterium]|nr:glycosyltransferase [Caldilineales bacterium]MDW8268397.1 glycosyltransferase [Anaerolineae bacterium]
MRRLRVLFLTAWYPTRAQPMHGVFIREHARAVQLYDDVVVVHLADPEDGLKRFWQLEEETDPTLTAGIPTLRSRYRAWPPKLSYGFFLVGAFRAYRHVVANGFQPDIVHAHIFTAGVPGVLLAQRWGLPVVISEHFSAFPRHTLPRQHVWKARWAFQRADWVLPVSRALQDGIAGYGIRGRFCVVPNAVDTALFRPLLYPHGSDVKRLLFVGRLAPIKGVPALLQAAALLQQQRQDWCLDLVGEGPQRPLYEQQAIELGLTGRVRFHGYHPHETIAQFMQAADLFVLPSLWENLPCVLLEARASGLPVVASAVGGIPEAVDPLYSLLVPPQQPEQLAQALSTMLDRCDFDQRATIAARAQAFSLQAVGQILHNLYQECLRR